MYFATKNTEMLKYCEVHAVGQQSTVETLFITVARQTTRDVFSMWSDPSLLRNNGEAAFSMGSVPVMTTSNSRGNRRGVFFGIRSPAI
jgi:hypothetical protein